MEQSQLRDTDALTRLLGLLSSVAVRLLQAETMVRSIPDRLASQAVDSKLLAFLLCRLRRADPARMPVCQFWRKVSKPGGFLARKRDGEPECRNCLLSECDGASGA